MITFSFILDSKPDFCFLARYPTEGLHGPMLGLDMMDELAHDDRELPDEPWAGAETGHAGFQRAQNLPEDQSHEVQAHEEHLREVSQHTVGRRRPGPVIAAIINRYKLEAGHRIGQVESYRYAHCHTLSFPFDHQQALPAPDQVQNAIVPALLLPAASTQSAC